MHALEYQGSNFTAQGDEGGVALVQPVSMASAHGMIAAELVPVSVMVLHCPPSVLLAQAL